MPHMRWRTCAARSRISWHADPAAKSPCAPEPTVHHRRSPVSSANAVLRCVAVITDKALAGLQTATAQFGHGSVEWASALCDFGNALLGTGQPERAADCFRQAASVKPRDDESRKERLTYLTNLGVALSWAGRQREAEKELRRGLKERLAFYGREHAGYAFGLEPLAELLRQRGKLREARQLAEEAVAN